MDIFRIAFIGHSHIEDHEGLEKRLEALIEEKLCGKEFVELYVGCKRDFDTLAAVAAKMVQIEKKKQNTRVVLIQPYPTKDDSFYERFFDEVRYPVAWELHPETAMTRRNKWLINHADLLIAYVESDRKDGAWTVLKYAEKRGVEIINLAIQKE